MLHVIESYHDNFSYVPVLRSMLIDTSYKRTPTFMAYFDEVKFLLSFHPKPPSSYFFFFLIIGLHAGWSKGLNWRDETAKNELGTVGL